MQPPESDSSSEWPAGTRGAASSLDGVASQDRDYSGNERRRHTRYKYTVRKGIQVVLRHPGGSACVCTVVPRDLSRGGFGFLHGSYVHEGTRCVVRLLSRTGKGRTEPGKVTYCGHVRGNVHEVGIAFDQEIDLSEYLSECQDSESEKEATPGGAMSFQGNVLYIDPSIDGVELARFLIRRLGAHVVAVTAEAQALDRIGQSKFDLVLINLDLAPKNGIKTAKRIREAGFAGPIAACTFEHTAEENFHGFFQGFDAGLVSPFEYESLAKLFAAHLGRRATTPKRGQPLVSTKWSYAPMRKLILRFLDRLEDRVRRLQHALEIDDSATAQRVCAEIKSSAAAYGYEPISIEAMSIEEGLAKWFAPEDIQAHVDELCQLCASAVLVKNDASMNP